MSNITYNLASNYAPRKTTFYNSRQLSLIRLSMKETVSPVSYKVSQRTDRPEPKGEGGGGGGAGGEGVWMHAPTKLIRVFLYSERKF